MTSVDTGAGLTGGPITTSGTISIATSGVTNAMLANSSITVTPGAGLSGGGVVFLGGSVTLSNTGVLTWAGRSGVITASFADITGTISTAQLPATVPLTDQPNTFSNTNTFDGKVTIGAGGVTPNGAGLKHSRGALILLAGATGTTTLNWSTAFADANYTVTCQAVDAAAGVPGLKVVRIQSVAAASVTVVVQNDAGVDRTGQIFCIAIHD